MTITLKLPFCFKLGTATFRDRFRHGKVLTICMNRLWVYNVDNYNIHGKLLAEGQKHLIRLQEIVSFVYHHVGPVSWRPPGLKRKLVPWRRPIPQAAYFIISNRQATCGSGLATQDLLMRLSLSCPTLLVSRSQTTIFLL